MAFDMEKVIFALGCVATVALRAGASAQMSYPVADGSLGRPIVQPSVLVRPLRAKWPKKYAGRLGFDKEDLVVQARYRLAEKLLARHLKNMNTVSGQWNQRNCLYDECQAASGMRSAVEQQQPLVAGFRDPFGSWRAVAAGGQPVSGSCFRGALWQQHG